MAREKYEIKDSILQNLSLDLSESNFALWNLLVDGVVSAIYVFEKLMDAYKAELEDKIAKKRIGSLSWYIDRTKEFQLGDDVVFNADGTISYPVVDVNKRLVAFATASESGNKVTIKVAKLADQELVPFSSEELLQLTNYVRKIMVAGTDLEVVSLLPDIIHVEATIYYNPIYAMSAVETYLSTALFAYKTNKEDSMFVKNDFIDYLRGVTGILDVDITLLEGIQGENTTTISRNYEIVAGYFNWGVTNVYNLSIDG
jgi:hypothetical protein